MAPEKVKVNNSTLRKKCPWLGTGTECQKGREFPLHLVCLRASFPAALRLDKTILLHQLPQEHIKFPKFALTTEVFIHPPTNSYERY